MVNVCGIEQLAAAAAHQEFRTPCPNRIATTTPRGRFMRLFFGQLRKGEDVAPHLPGGRYLVRIGVCAERDRQRGIAMNQQQHLGVVESANCHAKKVAHPDIYSHLHATDGTTQHDVFAVQLDPAHAAVCADIVRLEADRQRERVEPQNTARPGGIYPACCCLTPQGFYPPPGLSSRSMRDTLPKRVAESLKKAG